MRSMSSREAGRKGRAKLRALYKEGEENVDLSDEDGVDEDGYRGEEYEDYESDVSAQSRRPKKKRSRRRRESTVFSDETESSWNESSTTTTPSRRPYSTPPTSNLRAQATPNTSQHSTRPPSSTDPLGSTLPSSSYATASSQLPRSSQMPPRSQWPPSRIPRLRRENHTSRPLRIMTPNMQTTDTVYEDPISSQESYVPLQLPNSQRTPSSRGRIGGDPGKRTSIQVRHTEAAASLQRSASTQSAPEIELIELHGNDKCSFCKRHRLRCFVKKASSSSRNSCRPCEARRPGFCSFNRITNSTVDDIPTSTLDLPNTKPSRTAMIPNAATSTASTQVPTIKQRASSTPPVPISPPRTNRAVNAPVLISPPLLTTQAVSALHLNSPHILQQLFFVARHARDLDANTSPKYWEKFVKLLEEFMESNKIKPAGTQVASIPGTDIICEIRSISQFNRDLEEPTPAAYWKLIVDLLTEFMNKQRTV